MYFKNLFQDTTQRNEGDETQLTVYSSEALTHNYRNLSRTCDRLHELCPDAKILVIIRNQVDFLQSLYQEKIRWGFGCDMYRFIDHLCVDDGTLFGISYHAALSHYMSRFSQVKAVPFEILFLKETLLEIMDFIGVDSREIPFNTGDRINPAYSPLSHQIAIFINKFAATKGQYFDAMDTRYYNLLRRLAGVIDSAYYRLRPTAVLNMESELIDYVNAFYSEDNRRLQTLFDFDIRELGYSY